MNTRTILFGVGAVIVAGLLARDYIVEPNGPWYWGGSLHRADGHRWLAAPPANRLATAGIISAAKLKVDRRSRAAMDGLRPNAEALVDCVDKAASEKGYMPISQLSYQCLHPKPPGQG